MTGTPSGPAADQRPLPLDAVDLRDGFWGPRRETLRAETIDYVYERLRESGRIENFRLAAAGVADADAFNGRFYNDSDVYKWVEGACYLLGTAAGGGVDDGATTAPEADPLRRRIDEVVSAIGAAQGDDGYLNTYFTVVAPGKRWTNLGQMHELYCAGHLFEAAVAHHRATGEEDLLDVATRFADHIDRRFGDDLDGVPGHPEIELALVRLFRETGGSRYLDLARYFVDERGRADSRLREEVMDPEGRAGRQFERLLAADGSYDGTYAQDHAPLREQDTVEGHAVRATYLYAGAAEVAKETDDPDLLAALERLWTNMTTRRMYVTGGIGSTHDGERFTEDFDLPVRTSYAETCAALGSVLWNRRMFELTGEARYLDLLERTLYNAFLVGVSLDGTRFFYANPLEVGPGGHPQHDADPARLDTRRKGWFETACCPTNVPRLLGALGRYAFFVDDDATELAIGLHVGAEARTTLADIPVTLEVETDVPWDAATTIRVSPDEPVEFSLHLRIPAWCEDPSVTVDGEEVSVDTDSNRDRDYADADSDRDRVDADADRDRDRIDADADRDRDATDGDTAHDDTGTFVTVDRTWRHGDALEFSASAPVRFHRAHPAVESVAGRVALLRGPLVYCLEDVDNPRPLHQVAVDPDAAVETRREPDLLDGVTVLDVPALVPDREGWDDRLYREAAEVDREAATATAIPYYGWGHRDGDEMRVWLRTVGGG